MTTEYPAVVAVVARRAACVETPAVACTGTLIAPRVVLTAAHCFDVFGTEGRNYEVYFGPDLNGPEGSYVLGDVAIRHPEFDDETHENDVGLLRLAERAPVEPMALPIGVLDDTSVGGTARVVGFGVTRDESQPEGVKREGSTVVTELTATMFRSARDPSMTCQGDSGGPVFVDLGEGEELAGITVSGDPGCDVEASNVRVDAVLDFIAPFVEEAASAPMVDPTGTLPVDALCEMGCASNADCPYGMVCEATFEGSACRFLARSPGVLTEPCSTDDECGGGSCSRVWSSGPDACRCFEPCEAMGDPGEGGCAAAPVPAGPAPWLAVGVALLLVVRRRLTRR
ncbi:MAG: trypsin-like serine protease [Actinobacteria bacterium]|nr:trypsin-like serine protease [Actinomycetota bacterium]NIX18721.1 trypsin-like serine protease [Actinomycetota bacterium]